MIYLDKLNVKLKAILDKDVVQITKDQVYIPFLGNRYTEEELKVWLEKRSNLLSDIKNGVITETQIATDITNIKNSLSVADKDIADKITSNEKILPTSKPSNQDAYEKLVKIMLYKFTTTP